MNSIHLPLLEIVTFDLVIGFHVFRYFRAVPYAKRGRLVPVSVGIIAPLVNASWFLGAATVDTAVIFGGAGLIILLLGGEPTDEKEVPNLSPQPPQALGPRG